MSLAAPQLSVLAHAQHPPPAATEHPALSRQTFITIRGLSKSFNGTVVYDRFDLDLPQGEFISIFGPNGCGKSTLTNMISGLLPLDAGQVLFDGQTIQETRRSYVFQNYRDALFPWLRAIDNIHYPLKLMGFVATRTRGAGRAAARGFRGQNRSPCVSLHAVRRSAADRFDLARACH